ncbi:MAG: hypothetical protein GEU75_06325 [Dehalococcoidia bacterium]|nr:hypothetical protein [Dehalococcoidia bacterium]
MNRGRPRYPDVLTPREWQVLDLIKDGLTNEEIATRLGISIHGARYHVAEILSKLGVSSRADAVRMIPELPRRPRSFAFLSALLGKPVLAGKASALVVAGSLATVAVGLVLVVVIATGWHSSERSPHVETEGAVGLDVSADQEQGAATLISLGEEVSQAVQAAYPEAELKQIDVHGTGQWTEFRFLTATTTCEREFPPPDDLTIREFYADKCDVFVRVPRGASPAQWQWTTRDPWQGDMHSSVDLSSVHVGPMQVLETAATRWPGCKPQSATLGAAQGLTWTAFCTQADGGMFSGTADPETGEFRSMLDIPLYPPPVAPER